MFCLRVASTTTVTIRVQEFDLRDICHARGYWIANILTLT